MLLGFLVGIILGLPGAVLLIQAKRHWPRRKKIWAPVPIKITVS